MDYAPLFSQMAILMLIIAAGFALGKFGFIDTHTKKQVTRVLLYVTSPCLVIDSFLDNVDKADSLGLFSMVPLAFLAAAAMFAALFALSFSLNALIRAPKDRRPLYTMMTMFGNIGFMGFPVITAVSAALWGKGTESVGLFYGAIFVSVFNILIYTLGVFLMTRGRAGSAGIDPKSLLSPGVLSCAAGLALFLLKVRLPQVIAGALDSIGGLTGTLAMLLVGVTLSEMSAREVPRDVRTIVYVLIRQTAVPLAVWIVMKLLLRGGGETERLRVITLVMAGMPVASLVGLFATEYGGDEALAGRGVFVSTVLSVLTIPLLLAICLGGGN